MHLLGVGVALSLALGGCHGRPSRPPYPPNAPPAAQALIDAAAPRLSALQVSSAKIRLGRSIAGNLMFIAQGPGRFAGQIQVSGKELVSLALHEQGYALRYVAGGGLPSGFYSGPPSECAIAELLGVELAARELVALVLGGAPLLDAPREVIAQGWDRRRGEEVVRLRSDGYEEELRFRWLGEGWWPAGATLWRRAADGSLAWIWTIAHESPRTVGAAVLPGKSVITRPDGRRQQKVTITFREQNPDPALGAVGGDDGWDDGGGWEDEDTGGDDPGEGSEAASEVASAPAIPAVFVLNGDGLPARGDLCRGRR